MKEITAKPNVQPLAEFIGISLLNRANQDSQPSSPVYHGIGLQVFRVTKQPDETVFRRDMEVDDGAHNEPDHSDTVCNPLYCLTNTLLVIR